MQQRGRAGVPRVAHDGVSKQAACSGSLAVAAGFLATHARRRGLRHMPKISEFYGVVIRMYFNEHGPPHFHAKYGDAKAAIAFDGRVQRGKLPPRALRLVREWSRLRHAELAKNWSLARKGLELVEIAPLE